MTSIVSRLISLIAMLLCIGIAVVWARSPRHADLVLIKTPSNHEAGIAADRVGLLLAYDNALYEGCVSPNGQLRSIAFLPGDPSDFEFVHDALFDPQFTKMSFLGFKAATGKLGAPGILIARFSAFILPYWFLELFAFLVLVQSCRKLWTRWNRKRRGMCIGCGYDLRASATRCPECGMEIPRPLPVIQS